MNIIIDNGAHTVKAGFSNDDEHILPPPPPQFIIPTIVGYEKSNATMSISSKYIGNEAQINRDILNLSYPIINGRIINWNDMERIWNYTIYNKLKIEDPTETQSILLTIPEFSTDSDKERMLQTIFEIYNFNSIFISVPSILLANSHSTTSNNVLVIDSGETTTNIITIKNGQYKRNELKLNFAGYELTNYMMNLIQLKQEEEENDGINKFIAEEIKERLCYVAFDYLDEIEKIGNSSTSYRLPDGKVINIDNEDCLKCTESLFQPSLLSRLSDGIHQAIYNTIMKNTSEEDTRKELFNNIIISGGTTLFPGFINRLKKELINITPTKYKNDINIITPPHSADPKLATYISASIFSSKSINQQQMYISKYEYEENGPSIIHTKYM